MHLFITLIFVCQLLSMLGIYRLLFVCSFCPQNFGNGYLGRGLTYGDEILQDGRSMSLPGLLPFGELWPRG